MQEFFALLDFEQVHPTSALSPQRSHGHVWIGQAFRQAPSAIEVGKVGVRAHGDGPLVLSANSPFEQGVSLSLSLCSKLFIPPSPAVSHRDSLSGPRGNGIASRLVATASLFPTTTTATPGEGGEGGSRPE